MFYSNKKTTKQRQFVLSKTKINLKGGKKCQNI
jgi:hypothetical protein